MAEAMLEKPRTAAETAVENFMVVVLRRVG
jgi:hypothetical protein